MLSFYALLILLIRDSIPYKPERSITGITLASNIFPVPWNLFTYSAYLRYGGYFAEGTRLQVTNELGYRFQPYVGITMSTSYNDLRLPMPWGKRTYWLIGPRIDVTFTNKLYFTAFGQYNEQTKNINLNTRLQWRYKPASDFFIVYTDNYLPEYMSVKNRALVVKFTYWFTM